MPNVLSIAFRCACLLTGLAAVGLWARSHFVSDDYMWPARQPMPALVDSRVVATVPGGLVFYERSVFA
jgi:hypothetical protein